MKKILKKYRDKWQELDAHRKVLVKSSFFVLAPLLLIPNIERFNIFYNHLKSDSKAMTKPIVKVAINNQTDNIIEIIVAGPIHIPGVYRIPTNTSLKKLLYFAGGTADKHLYLPKKYRNYSVRNWLNNNRINFQTWLQKFKTQSKFNYERQKDKKTLSRRTLRYR